MKKNSQDKGKFKKEFVKRLVDLKIRVLQFARKLRKDPNLWSVADQLVRSIGLIGANVVEAKSSSSKREYVKYSRVSHFAYYSLSS